MPALAEMGIVDTVNALSDRRPYFVQPDTDERVELVDYGAGCFRPTDLEGIEKAAGLFHHSLLSARFSEYLLNKLGDPEGAKLAWRAHAGVSHLGTFPSNALKKAQNGDYGVFTTLTAEEVGVGILAQTDMPRAVTELVAALGSVRYVVGDKHDTSPYRDPIWDSPVFKVALYADHRVTNTFVSLAERLAGFIYANHIEKDTDSAIAEQQKQKVIESVKQIIAEWKDEKLSLEGGIAMLKEGAHLQESPRNTNIEHVMQLYYWDAQTESMLENAKIEVHAITPNDIPVSEAEEALRYMFVRDAVEDIAVQMEQLAGGRLLDDIPVDKNEQFEQAFPRQAWWWTYARELRNRIIPAGWKFVTRAPRVSQEDWNMAGGRIESGEELAARLAGQRGDYKDAKVVDLGNPEYVLVIAQL